MPIKIEIPTLAEIWRMGFARIAFVMLVSFAYVVIYFWLFGFERFWIVPLSLSLFILDVDNGSLLGEILAAVIGKRREKPVAIICGIVLILLVPGLFLHLSADGISAFQKSRYRLSQFSTYTTMDGVRLHNSCWLQILRTNYDPAMLIDKDNDGFSQYCEAYDDSYIVTNFPITTRLNLRFFSDGWYILGMPIVWDNIQTSDPSKAVAGYEIIFKSVDALSGEVKEQIESCPGKFDAMQRVFSCPPSQETVKWLTLNSLTPIYMTIRSYDSLGRRTPLLQEQPLHLVI